MSEPNKYDGEGLFNWLDEVEPDEIMKETRGPIERDSPSEEIQEKFTTGIDDLAAELVEQGMHPLEVRISLFAFSHMLEEELRERVIEAIVDNDVDVDVGVVKASLEELHDARDDGQVIFDDAFQ